MKAEPKLPGFSSITSKEDSVLYDDFSYNSLFSFDLSFSTPKLYFSIESALKPSSFKTGCSAEFYHQGFSSILSISEKSPSFTIKFPSKKFLISDLLNIPTNKNFYFRPSLHIKVGSVDSKLKPDFNLCTAVVNDNLKTKMKLTSKRLSGNLTFGSAILGFGVRGGLNIIDFAFSNYSIGAWFCEESSKVKMMFNGNWKQPEKNTINGYFYYKLFQDVDFVTKLNSNGKEKHNLIIGCQGKFFEKGLWKIRGCNKGKIAFGVQNKILPRTKVRVSSMINTFNLEQSKFGFYFNFHAKERSINK